MEICKETVPKIAHLVCLKLLNEWSNLNNLWLDKVSFKFLQNITKMWALNRFLSYGRLRALDGKWHAAKINLRCARVNMPIPHFLAFMVSEISSFIRTLHGE